LNRRRRTVLTVSFALLAGVPLLAACDAHPGAAAVVGGKRIEVSSLQAQVNDVRTAQQASPGAADLISSSSQLDQSKLNGMIFDKVLQKAANDHGVGVSSHEIQVARQQAAAQSGGEKALDTALLQQGQLAPGQIDGAVRRDLLMEKLSAAVGGDPSAPQQDPKLLAALVTASKQLHVDVNPRYGAWDNGKVSLGSAKIEWIKQVTAQAPAAQPPTSA
jgi:SurA N-terminal domain